MPHARRPGGPVAAAQKCATSDVGRRDGNVRVNVLELKSKVS